jgi:peptidoglycan/LPS O-acetylase OafA/YrhL
MKYRREIDGLRAVAVLAVVLFHAGFDTFSGGFVGVDVFFVISGYLITSIILYEKEAGTFSLISFYERRVRRILPPLFLVMAVCIPFARLWLLPTDMKEFSQSLITVSLFASNILFWRESTYFDSATTLKPLLHTWSLAVEEQYYVLFPLFIALTWRLGHRWIAKMLAIVTVISLMMAQWGAYASPAATFFLLPTRGWELAIGAAVAFYFTRKQARQCGAPTRETLGALGILLIGYAVFAYDKTTPFPSLFALVPTSGTALVILFATQATTVGRVLGSKALVGIGLISYSVYLWHQPIFVFARQRSVLEPSTLAFISLSIASFGLAYLSWRFIEQPFRDKHKFKRKHLFLFAAIGSGGVILVGLWGHMTGGNLERFAKSSKLVTLDENMRGNYGLSEQCEGVFTVSDKCRTSDVPDVLVWGDSYAMHLVQGLLSSNPDAKIIQATVSDCGPIFDIAPINQS